VTPPKEGDIFQFRSATWQIRAFDGVGVDIKCLDDGTNLTVPIAVVLADDTYVGPQDTGPSIADQRRFSLLSPQRKAQAEFWYRQMYEVKYGFMPEERGVVDTEPPSATVRQRLDAKRHELLAKGIRVSSRTMWRKWNGFSKHGVLGCADQRGMPGHVRLSAIDQQVELAITQIKKQLIDKSTPTKKQIIEMTGYLLAERDIAVPKRTTMYDLLDKLDRGEHTTGDATSRRNHASSPDRPYGKTVSTIPGELVELDSTPLDAMVVMPDGNTCRVDLAAAIDIATGCIPAAILRPKACKTVDALELLTKSMVPQQMLPGWADTVATARNYLPDLISPVADLQTALARKPLIDVRGVVVDRGGIFVSDAFIRALEFLAVTYYLAPPRTPTAKPHIERALATVADGFVKYIHGYKGRSVNHRGRKPEQHAVWPLPLLQAALDDWLITVYHNTSRSGPKTTLSPRANWSPNVLYNALSSATPTPPRTLSREEWIGLQPCQFRRINRYGVNFERLIYSSQSPRFHEIKKTTSPNRKQKGKWEVRYDPNNLMQIWIRDESISYDQHGRQVFIDNGWIECRWELADFTTVPFGLDVLHAILPSLPKRNTVDKLVLDRAEAIHRQLMSGPPQSDRATALSRAEASTGRANLARQELCAGPPPEAATPKGAAKPETSPAIRPPANVEPIQPLRFTEGW
jgi:putative transposase